METLLGIAAGIGLSAACGFRVFVPLLMINLAAISGHLHLASGFEWIGNYYATMAFATATIIEVLAYYIPWLDNILDTITSPLAIVAGLVATASVVTDLSPALKWTLAIIAGGGIAGIVQGATTAIRTKSSLLTAGLGNHLFSTFELSGSLITALLAIIFPIVCIVLIIVFCIFAICITGRYFFRRTKTT